MKKVKRLFLCPCCNHKTAVIIGTHADNPEDCNRGEVHIECSKTGMTYVVDLLGLVEDLI